MNQKDISKENSKNSSPAAQPADRKERAVLVAVVRDNQDPRQAEEYLDELEFLAETADIVSVKRLRSGLRSRRPGSMSARANCRRLPITAVRRRSTW